MKHCTYCDTNYAVAEVCCPSCSAVDFETKCDKCATVHNAAFCPNCRLGNNEKPSYCTKCGFQTKDRVCSKCGYDVAATSSVTGAIAAVASKAACKISGHRWLGCKCTRCGELRDESHEFQPITGKCEQKCSVCGKSENLPHQWNADKCNRCGGSKGLIDKLFDPVSTRMPFLHLEKESNRVMAGLGIFLLLMFAFLGIMPSVESDQKGDGNKIAINSSSSELKGKNYEDVVTQLKKVGFTNIKTEVLADLVTGWLTKDGEVEAVKIDDKTTFGNDTKFPKEAAIIVTYHTFPKNEKKTESTATSSIKQDVPQQTKNDEAAKVDIGSVVPAENAKLEDEKKIEVPLKTPTVETVKVALESTFPVENAKRAAVVAITNAYAIDVFKEDRQTYDVSKFHSYADTSGNVESYFFNVTSWGNWSVKDDKEWHVDSLILKNIFGTVANGSLDVKYDGNKYIISNIKGTFGKGSDLSEIDKGKKAWAYLTVSPELIKNNRN